MTCRTIGVGVLILLILTAPVVGVSADLTDISTSDYFTEYSTSSVIELDKIGIIATSSARIGSRDSALRTGTAATSETDTDGDGLNDTVEQNLGTNISDSDSDDDGLSDFTEIGADGEAPDTDSDGLINPLDPDDDGDGIPTSVEVADAREFASGIDFDGVPNWLDTDSDGDGVSDSNESVSDLNGDGVPEYLDNDADNDGLPDFYERNQTGTDPKDNDSDAPSTVVNESNNDIIDGIEDFDDDGFSSVREYQEGTDPLDNDTDGDNVTDGDEIQVLLTDPIVADSDDDGIPDGQEDFDGDGLSNRAELDVGTSPNLANPDNDGLSDPAEIANETDPFDSDTDDDVLSDSEELRSPYNTNPVVADTDNDGVNDSADIWPLRPNNASRGVDIRNGTLDIVDGEIYSVLSDNSTGLFAAGAEIVGETLRPWIIRTDQSGTPQWVQRYPNAEGAPLSLVQLSQDRFAFLSQTADKTKSWVTIINETGATQAELNLSNRPVPNSNGEFLISGRSMAASGNYLYVTGRTDAGSIAGVSVFKISANGTIQNSTSRVVGVVRPVPVISGHQDQLLLAVSRISNPFTNEGDLVTNEYNANTLSRGFDFNIFENNILVINSQPTTAGQFVIIGQQQGSAWAGVVEREGLNWSATYETGDGGQPWDIAQTPGGYVATGFDGQFPTETAWAIGLNNQGQLRWRTEYSTGTSLNTVVPSLNGTILAGGQGSEPREPWLQQIPSNRTSSSESSDSTRFDTNGQPGIQRDEVLSALVAYGSGGEIGGQQVDRGDVLSLLVEYSS